MIGDNKIWVKAFLQDGKSFLAGMRFHHVMAKIFKQSDRARRNEGVIIAESDG